MSEISFVHEAASRSEDPLALIVEVDEDGHLTLNDIQTGSLSDPSILIEKLRLIFEDRRRLSIGETVVSIETLGKVSFEDIEALIASLKPLRPSRITVTTR